MSETFDGLVRIVNTNRDMTVGLDGENGDIAAGGNGSNGDIVVKDQNDMQIIWLKAATGQIVIGGSGKWGSISLKDIRDRENCVLNSGGNVFLGGNGDDGDLLIKDANGNEKIRLDGQSGDIKLAGADCAENFEVDSAHNAESGAVMVIDGNGKLTPCSKQYDTRVAGVVSGAGNCAPGIILNECSNDDEMKPIALNGRVYCKVDASSSSIEVGSLLTTSSTPGHAMKATDKQRAFGSVIGKALQPLESGKGMISILIALH